MNKPQPETATFIGAIRNIGRGLYAKTAKFAGYQAASPSPSTRVGGRIGTNANSTFAAIQRVGMSFTAEMVAKNSAIGAAYLKVRNIYCRPTHYKPDTGDDALNREVSDYCRDKWRGMGMACSMQDAVARTLHIETPVRGDAGLIFWRDAQSDLRLLEFSADQLGEIYQYTSARLCSLSRDENGRLIETGGNDCTYYAGRYFRGADCVAYKIYERTNSWYANPRIYDAADVIYTVDPFNFRGLRGVTIFANALEHMQKGEDMLQAALSAAQRQARTAGFVFNAQGQPDEPSYETDTYSDGSVKYFERVPNGPLMEYFYNGDSANFTSPDSPGPELIQGVETADERVAIALGMTYGFLVSGAKLGGAPSRLDCNRSGKEIERIEDDISRPCLNRIAQVTILDGVRKGELQAAPNITRGHWQFTNLPTADAFRDSMDDIKSVRAGQDSNSRVAGRYGTTFAEIMRDKEDETFLAYRALANVQARLKEAGIGLTPSIADIYQVTDNPQQTAAAEQIDKGNVAQPVPGATAKMAFDESKHPRGQPGNAGEFGPGGGSAKKPATDSKKKDAASCDERCQRAKHAAVRVDKTTQQKADEVEHSAAKSLGGISFKDSEPVDVVIGDPNGVLQHGIEFKHVSLGANDKLTMNTYAQIRKINWEKQNKSTFHTLVFDDRDGEKKRVIYYRRGVAGSARLGSMYRCKDLAEAQAMMAMDEKKLPEAAQRTDGKLRVGKWKPFQDDEGKGFRNIKTGETFRAKK